MRNRPPQKLANSPRRHSCPKKCVAGKGELRGAHGYAGQGGRKELEGVTVGPHAPLSETSKEDRKSVGCREHEQVPQRDPPGF